MIGRDHPGLTIVSTGLVVAGLLFLALSIFFEGVVDFTLPLIFLTLGPAMVALAYTWGRSWRYAPFLFLPAGVLLAFGVIFLLNVLTSDWQAWAYAWLLLLFGLGIGGALAAQMTPLPQIVHRISLGVAFAGITFFGVFGAIAGGMLIRVAAPLALVAGGLGLRFGWVKALLAGPDDPAHPRLWLPGDSTPQMSSLPVAAVASTAPELVEPLSQREQEVLRLIAAGRSNAEIAEALSLAPSTVKTHINNIYGKLGVQTRVQAVNKARDLGV